MSQSHEKQLIEALRAVCKPSGDDVPPGLGGESVRAIRRELAPLVELAAIPHQGYLDVASKKEASWSGAGLH